MSSSRKRIVKQPTPQPKTPSIVLPVVIAGAAVVVIAAIFLLTQINQRAPFVPEVTGAPAVQVSQERFDYGDVKNNTPVHTSFQVRNVGDQTLLIFGEPHIEVVEGCCPPRARISSQRLAPGEVATVSFSFSMHEGMDGAHDFRVHLRTNDPATPEQEVVVLSNWVP